MEKLKKTVDKLDPEALNELMALTGSSQRATPAALLDRLLSITGFTTLLRSLSREELTLVALIAEANGLQFSDLEKRASFPDQTSLDMLLNRLERLQILYINKNRKHLNNRFDKIYIHTPLIEMIEKFRQSPSKSIGDIRSHFADAGHTQIRDKNNFLLTLYNNGGVMPLADAHQVFGDSLDELVDSFSKKELCRLVIQLTFPFSSFVMLEAAAYIAFFEKEKKKSVALNVNNRYLLINNINYCHDIISSFGFFLTQQNSFRKNDFKRLSDAIAHLKNIEGREISNDDTALFCLFCMDSLGMLTVEKQIIFSDIAPLNDQFDTPETITRALLKKFRAIEHNGLFIPPVPVPDAEQAMSFLEKLYRQPGANYEIILHEFVLERYENWFSQNETLALIPDFMKTSGELLTWLALLGLVQRNGTSITLSEQGFSLFGTEEKINPSPKKDLYINPDFTLLMQADDISDRLHYFLLNFCEIVQMDVMLQVKVTRESVSRAYKRGMNVERLVSELEEHSKNPVPQNLIFLIHEWVRQTVTVSLFFGAILEVNTPAFLDNLEFHKSGKKILVSRISDTIAVINVENIDEITRLARKHNALVSIKLA